VTPGGEPFCDVLYAMPALWARLLAEHVPDETGRRCRAGRPPGRARPPRRGRAASEGWLNSPATGSS
jgi:hypothetical protein